MATNYDKHFSPKEKKLGSTLNKGSFKSTLNSGSKKRKLGEGFKIKSNYFK